MTNLGDASALAISRRNKKVHQTIERLAIQMPTGFKHTIRKKIYVCRKSYRHLDGRIFGIHETTDGRTGGW
jgi:hypothetical protein